MRHLFYRFGRRRFLSVGLVGLGLSLVVACSVVPPNPPPETSEHSPQVSPLKRRDVPPAGVAGSLPQLVIGEGAATWPCRLVQEQGPAQLVAYPGSKERGRGFQICYWGFDLDRDIAVEVTRPDGSVWHEQVPRGNQMSPWWFHPWDPLGVYAVTAKQGTLQASTRFTLVRASYANVVEDSGIVFPGATFHIFLMGFEPSQPVRLFLYRCLTSVPAITCSTWKYATELPTVRVDEHGEASYALGTEPDDPTGIAYRVATADSAKMGGRNQFIGRFDFFLTPHSPAPSP